MELILDSINYIKSIRPDISNDELESYLREAFPTSHELIDEVLNNDNE